MQVERLRALKSGILSPLETLAQSIALLGPTITPAMIIPLVFAASGNGTWLVFAAATTGVLLTAITLNAYSTRSASSGSLYGYVQLAFGDQVAIVAGWSLFFAYITGGAAALVGFANYFSPAVVSLCGMHLPALLTLMLCASLCWFVSYRDIQLSTNIMLALECLSLLLVFVVVIAALFQHGLIADSKQLSLDAVTPESFRLGLVMAIFSFVGFESASTLGEEANAPLKSIPAAMILSVVLPGALFVLCSYAEIVGFQGSAEPLSKSTAPLNQIAQRVGLASLSVPIDIGASISFFSCVLAAINAGARVLLSMGQHDAVHPCVTYLHASNRTPYVAAAVTAMLMLSIPVVLIIPGSGLLDVYGWIGTISTFGFMGAYFLACAGAPVYLRKQQVPTARTTVVAAASMVFLLTALIGNVYPMPAAPYCYLPYMFLVWLVAATLCSGLYRKRKRDRTAQVS